MGSQPPTPTPGYRGRIAPSPTGYLHVGHARTFWTATQRARDADGTLVLRMEDLDPERSRAAFADAAIEDLRWLGIRWREGPDKGGPFAPYEQSRRRGLYLEAWRLLYRRGFLFPCCCSRKDLQAAVRAPHESSATVAAPGADSGPVDAADQEDDEPIYPGTCRPLHEGASQPPGRAAAEIDSPEGYNWRFRVPDGEAIEFEDRNLGPQRFVAGRDFGDFVVWRRDGVPGSPRTGLRPWGGVPGSPRTGLRPWGGGVPSYQLACVADDAAMRITEVVRGADLLKSTARQMLLNRALGYSDPHWYHCRLVVDHNGRRLAKRHDALSLRALRQRGLTPMNILSAELPIEA
jgi:glutamyl-tRNA synthetase